MTTMQGISPRLHQRCSEHSSNAVEPPAPLTHPASRAMHAAGSQVSFPVTMHMRIQALIARGVVGDCPTPRNQLRLRYLTPLIHDGKRM